MLQEGLNGFDLFREVTKYLQLQLRKEGINLETSAEFEVVRILKEKSCYLSLNPAKEEKEIIGNEEGYALPDGNTIKVTSILIIARKRKI